MLHAFSHVDGRRCVVTDCTTIVAILSNVTNSFCLPFKSSMIWTCLISHCFLCRFDFLKWKSAVSLILFQAHSRVKIRFGWMCSIRRIINDYENLQIDVSPLLVSIVTVSWFPRSGKGMQKWTCADTQRERTIRFQWMLFLFPHRHTLSVISIIYSTCFLYLYAISLLLLLFLLFLL